MERLTRTYLRFDARAEEIAPHTSVFRNSRLGELARVEIGELLHAADAG